MQKFKKMMRRFLIKYAPIASLVAVLILLVLMTTVIIHLKSQWLLISEFISANKDGVMKVGGLVFASLLVALLLSDGFQEDEINL